MEWLEPLQPFYDQKTKSMQRKMEGRTAWGVAWQCMPSLQELSMRLASPSEDRVAPEVDLCRAVLYVLTHPAKGL